MTVAVRRGARILREEPRLVIGTIHSVKGGEADVVFLSPELSPAGAVEWRRNRDATVRQFYVGMTRAREALVVVSASPRAACVQRLTRMGGGMSAWTSK